MGLKLRMAALVVLLGGLAVLSWVIASEDASGSEGAAAAPAGARYRWQSSEQCAGCHREVWDEWQGSHHQIAYLNPEVRKLSDDFRNKECQACHLPRPVSVTGYGKRTLPRLTHPEHGVGCLTCHLADNGDLLGRDSRPDAPCGPRASPELVSVELCASCHNQHGTTDQWRASRHAREGTSCNDCHMPRATRSSGGAPRGGRAHRFPGAHDLAMLRRAGRFEVRSDGGDVVLSVRNEGAGHNFPTEERHRAVDMMVRFVRADGSHTAWHRAFRLRQPYRDEAGEDTQLAADATREVRVPVPAGAQRAVARLWYRLTPFCGDDDPESTLLEEREVELR